MLKNRPVMMLLTGIGLALVLWGLVSLVQTDEAVPTPDIAQDNSVVSVDEDHMILPPSVLSVRQAGTTFVLTGTGVAGSGLSLMQGDQILATTKMDAEGEWSISFAQRDLPDVMEINVLMITPDGHLVNSDQSLLLLKGPKIAPVVENESLEDGVEVRDDEERELVETLVTPKLLILLSAPGAHSRVLQTPYDKLPGQDGFVLEAIDYDNLGGVIFSGLSLRQGKVRIYANGNLVGESRVDTTGRWSLIFGNIMPMGSYNIGVELVSDTGLNSTTLTLPFERMQPMFEAEDSPEILVQHLEDRIQVGRALYGGGYQFTVVYAPIVLVE